PRTSPRRPTPIPAASCGRCSTGTPSSQRDLEGEEAGLRRHGGARPRPLLRRHRRRVRVAERQDLRRREAAREATARRHPGQRRLPLPRRPDRHEVGVTERLPGFGRPLSGLPFTAAMDADLIELDERHGDGIAVGLYWRQATTDVVLVVSDVKTGESFGVQVPGERAMDAFRHPYVYVSSPRARVVAPDAAGAAGTATGLRGAA